MNNEQVFAETRKRLEVTSTDFESSSTDEESKSKSKLAMEKHSRLDDWVKKFPKSGAASLPKEKKERANVKNMPPKTKIVEEKVKNPGADKNADKVIKSSKTDVVKREKDGKKKKGKHAAKEKSKAYVSSTESISSSESSDSGEDMRSKKKKSSNKKKKSKKSSSSDLSETSSSSSSSSSDSDTESDCKRKRTSTRRIDRAIKKIQDWRIRFSGEGKEGPEGFLHELESCKNSCRISDAEMLDSLPAALKGEAGVWYTMMKPDFQSWKQFKKSFREQYIGDIDQRDILDDLEKRSQAKGENITTFLARYRLIIGYLKRPPTMRKQVKMVLRKLLPGYQKYMTDKKIRNLSDVAEYGRKYEKLEELERRYVPPPPKDKMHIKSAAYVGPASKGKVAACADQGVDEVAAIGENKNPPQNKGKNGQGNQSKGQGQQSKTQNNNVQNSTAVSKPTESDFAAVISQQAEFMKLMQQNLEALTKAHAAQKEEYMRTPSRSQGAPFAQGQSREPAGEFKGSCFYCKETGHRSSECPKKQCYKCHKFGHFANRCPSAQDEGKNADRCQGCGADGVKIHDCQRCKKVVELMGNGVAGAQNGPLHPQPTL